MYIKLCVIDNVNTFTLNSYIFQCISYICVIHTIVPGISAIIIPICIPIPIRYRV